MISACVWFLWVFSLSKCDDSDRENHGADTVAYLKEMGATGFSGGGDSSVVRAPDS